MNDLLKKRTVFMLDENLYLAILLPFYDFAQKQIREGGGRTAYYGTGEAGHWAIQSNFNVAGSLGVMAAAPADFAAGKEEILDLALKLFRYNLATHHTGNAVCTCGQQWGGSWISVLGLERMVAGQLAMEDFFTAEDHENLRKLRIYEADWLLDNYPVCADIRGDSGKNKPESNYWNGSFLYRTAMDYADAPRRAAYLEKSCELLLNAVSHPSDAASEQLFHNKKLRNWHVGPNFTENYSLDHHGYMNVGYSAVTLSHAAYLYFYCQARNWDFPAEAAHHIRDLWNVVKHMVFPDGRLLRIGGDSRARYCYCQMYLLPVLLMAQELWKDTQAASFEKGMLDLLKHEQKCNQDGSFFGTRLRDMQYQSRYYYTRLESDPFAVLGFGAYFRSSKPAALPSPADDPPDSVQWSSQYHGAVLLRNDGNIRSICRKGSSGANILNLPQNSSDLAEWGGNGLATVPAHGYRTTAVYSTPHFQKIFDNGFIHSGTVTWQEVIPRGEGEPHCNMSESRYACAALPDNKTMIVLEKVTALKEHSQNLMRSISWQIPNDLHNNSLRRYRAENLDMTLHRLEAKGVIDTASNWINVDDKLTLTLGYGADSLLLYAPAKARGDIMLAFDMTSLYVNEICGHISLNPFASFMPGDVMADTGYAVISSCTAAESRDHVLEKLDAPPEIRAVKFTGQQTGSWIFAANFSAKTAVSWNSITLKPGECVLIN